jgi:hypothetical protein
MRSMDRHVPPPLPSGRPFLEPWIGGPGTEPFRFGGITPAVVDTDVLLDDLVWTTATGRVSGLREAAMIGSIRFFAWDDVAAQVDRKLDPARDHFTMRSGLPHANDLRRVWEADYLPLIRFVMVDASVVEDARVRRVLAEDATDAGTAALSAILAPCLAISRDRDLRRNGLAAPDWRAVTRHSRVAAEQDQTLVPAAVGSELTARALFGLARWLVTTRAGFWVCVVFAAGLYGAYRLGFVSRERAIDIGNRTKDTMLRLGQHVATAAGAQAEAYGHLRGVAVEAQLPPSPLHSAMRMLAGSGRPLTATEIARRVRATGLPISPSAMLSLLRESSSVVPVVPSRWQLGRHLLP